VLDERMVHRWSHDTILPIINFSLCSYPTSETGGFTPFQLKYGTEDAKYFHLPTGTPENVSKFISQLDENIKLVRELSQKAQEEIATERLQVNSTIPHYEFGDLILWNPLEHENDFHESKLSPRMLGPYEVLEQHKNDIAARHLVNRNKVNLHVSRVIPFFGTREEAVEAAKLDKNQFAILSINYYKGNPHIRTSMSFSVTFEDQTIQEVPYNADLVNTAQIEQFIDMNKELQVLKQPAKDTKKFVSSLNKLAITAWNTNEDIYINARVFDGLDRSWFDSLNMPDPKKKYLLKGTVKGWKKGKFSKILCHIELSNSILTLSNYDVCTCCYKLSEIYKKRDSFVLIDKKYGENYPQILI
jgi:hypothetical protein